ncbi:hypothetical protein BH09PAT1_BH09PAT1_6240 [soil metagenome]
MNSESEFGRGVIRSVSTPGEPVRYSVDPIALTQELVRIPSHNVKKDAKEPKPPVGTKNVVAYAENLAKHFGFETHIIPTFNSDGTVSENDPNLLIGRNLDELPVILLGTHIDTVQPYANGEHKAHSGDLADGFVYGVGATDSKGGGASMFAAIANAKDSLPTSYAVLFSAREETDLMGIKAVAEHYDQMQKVRPGSGTRLMVGAGNDESIATGSRGVLEANFTLDGRTSHTSRRLANSFTDAIEASDQITQSLQDQINTISPHDIYGNATLKRTGIRGGFYTIDKEIVDTTNQVPNRSITTLGIRLNGMPIFGNEFNPDVLKNMVTTLVDDYKTDGLSLADYNTLAFVRAAITDPKDVEWIVDLIEQQTGKKMETWDYGNRGLEEIVELISVLDHKPSLIITGPADQSQYHQPNEHISVESLQQYADIYRKIITDGQFQPGKVKRNK